jgi:prepilin-type N-terminal cleavage/methylation domain-containing protein
MESNGITSKYQKAFTLVELLVVIAIIAILVAILLPSLNKVREQGKMIVCKNNLKGLGFAMRLYADDHKDMIPALGCMFDELGRFDNGNWYQAPPPTQQQYERGFEWGYLWEYTQSSKVYVCPTLTMKQDPRNNPDHVGWVWGWLPLWSYCVNGQAGMSLGNTTGGKEFRANLDLPSPYDVFMMYEQDDDDWYAFDNSVSLFNPWYDVGQDSLGDYHAGDDDWGRGNLVYFDLHVEDMSAIEFRDVRRATEEGTIQLCGGWNGFYWP